MLPWKPWRRSISEAPNPAAADDHDLLRPPGCGCDAAVRDRCRFLPYEHLAVAYLGRPARNRTERGRPNCLAGAQAKAGVVPRAPHRVVDHQPFRERTAIVGAGGGDREEFVAAAREQDRVVADVSGQHLSISECVSR
jgi:hypothetical protein